ncbi:hypothetical protein HDU67_008899 [Dinochytrium kinnereticum]|nr:hypothetical protein HDU67_008899 [Dinochytrium kinnereticum]
MEPLDDVVQSVHCKNVNFVLVSRVERSKKEWSLLLIRETDAFVKTFDTAARDGLLGKNIEHKTWSSYAAKFMAGVKEGEIYIPNASSTEGPLIVKFCPDIFVVSEECLISTIPLFQLKVFPDAVSPLVFELDLVQSVADYKRIMSTTIYSIGSSLSEGGVSGVPLRDIANGGPRPSILNEIEVLKRDRDHWKSMASAAVSSQSALSSQPAAPGKGERKRIHERSLLNPRVKVYGSIICSFL